MPYITIPRGESLEATAGRLRREGTPICEDCRVNPRTVETQCHFASDYLHYWCDNCWAKHSSVTTGCDCQEAPARAVGATQYSPDGTKV